MDYSIIGLVIFVGTLWVPLFFTLELSFDEKFTYRFKLFNFDLTSLIESFLESESKPKTTPKKKSKAKKKKKKLHPILKRLLATPLLYKSLAKWFYCAIKIFYPMTKPKWKNAEFSFGTNDPYETSEWVQLFLVISPFSPIQPIKINPNWQEASFKFEAKANWSIFPIIIAFRTLLLILKFPIYSLFKSLYLALSEKRWNKHHPKISRLKTSLKH
jgi:hypothetical protein